MTTILLPVIVVVLFAIGVVSPHFAGKIQRKANDESGWLKRCANWLWDPITWWAKKSIETTRKVITKTTQLGKDTNKEVSNKK